VSEVSEALQAGQYYSAKSYVMVVAEEDAVMFMTCEGQRWRSGGRCRFVMRPSQ
jgi:hypothetical protein